MSSERLITVLLADDDPVSLGFAEKIFQRNGCKTYAALTATEALHLADLHHPDLIVLDIQIPGTDGVSLLRQMIKNYGSRFQPVFVALTGESRSGMQARFLQAGFSRIITKPATSHQLLSCLDIADKPDEHADRIHSGPAGPAEPALDDEGALQALGGDRQLLMQLRRILLGELQATCPLIDECLLQGHFDEATFYLHRLNAGAGYCGATSLQGSCKTLEKMLQTAGSATIANEYTKFLAECDRFEFCLALDVSSA